MKDTVEKNALSVIKGLVKIDGIFGLYKGFGNMIADVTPARIIFFYFLEMMKVLSFNMVEPFKLFKPTHVAFPNGVAGMIAFVFAQVVFVPIDVYVFFSFIDSSYLFYCIQFYVYVNFLYS